MPADQAFAPQRLFGELKWEVFKIILVNELLNSSIVFFILNFATAFFNLSFFFALLPALAFLTYRMIRMWRSSTVRRIEQGNPEVNEILRTAYDNRQQSSFMIQALMYELQRKISTVSTGVLLSPRRVFVKFVIVILLAITPVFIIGFTPQIVQDNPLEGMSAAGFFSGISLPFQGEAELQGIQLNETDDIYGEADMIQLGDEELTVALQTGASEVTLDEYQDPEDRSFGYSNFPPDVSVPENTSAAIGVGIYADEERDLINTYSCKTKGTCPD